MEGWIKLDRKLATSDAWLCDKFSRGQAWVDLLMLASHKKTCFYKRGVKVEIERGEVAWSERRLSDRWGWSRSKTRLFLRQLEDAHRVNHRKTNVTTLISITNYDQYQSERTTERTTEGPQKDQYKNDKNIIGEFPMLDTAEFRAAWAEKEQHRKQRKMRPFTEIGLRKQFARFCEWGVGPSIEAIQLSIANDWQGVHPPKQTKQQQLRQPELVPENETPQERQARLDREFSR